MKSYFFNEINFNFRLKAPDFLLIFFVLVISNFNKKILNNSNRMFFFNNILFSKSKETCNLTIAKNYMN